MTDLKLLTDEQLIEETHRLARSVSYYNAAEGNWSLWLQLNWSQETADRNAVKAEFWAALDEMAVRDLEFVNKGYLL